MQVSVSKDSVIITDSDYMIHKGEYRANGVEYEFSSEYEGLTCKAIFNDGINMVEVPITTGTSIIPYEVLSSGASRCELRVYGYETEEVEEDGATETRLKLRYSPAYAEFDIRRGSYIPDAASTEEITPSQFEQYSAKLEEGLEELEEAIASIDVDTQYARDMGDYAKDQGDYAKNQGDRAKDLVDNIDTTLDNIRNSIPTKTSDLTNDSGFIDKSVNDLTNYYDKTNLYTKTEIDSKISSVYKYKGSVATYADLPSSDLTIGDVYNVESDGSNYAWNGTVWDKLGGDVDLSNYYNKSQTDTLLSGKVDNSALNDYYTKTRTDELLATKVDTTTLTNYVTNTDYATDSTGGVIKVMSSNGLGISSAGALRGATFNYNDYLNKENFIIIDKGTLENTITGKGLVSNTDYATDSVGGVIKTSSGTYGVQVLDGFLAGGQTSYANYANKANQFIISKGTLENVIVGKDLTTKAYVDGLVGDIATTLDTIQGEVI